MVAGKVALSDDCCCGAVGGVGACCYGTWPDKICADVGSESECDALEGDFHPGRSCDDGIDCTEGACCEGVDCTITAEAECAGEFQGYGTTCDPNPCEEVPTGACCAGTDCTIETPEGCAGLGGTYLGDNTECLELTCACPCGFDAFDGSGRKFLRYNREISGEFDLTEVNECPAPDGFTYTVNANASATFEEHYEPDGFGGCTLVVDIDSSSSDRTETLNGSVIVSCSTSDLGCFCNVVIPEHNQCTGQVDYCHSCGLTTGLCDPVVDSATMQTANCDLSDSCDVITAACTGDHHAHCDRTGSYIVIETLSEECLPI